MTESIRLTSEDMPTLRKVRELFVCFKRDGTPTPASEADTERYIAHCSYNVDFFSRVIDRMEKGEL